MLQKLQEGRMRSKREITAAAAITAGAITALLAITTGAASATPTDPIDQIGHAVGGAQSNSDNNALHGGGGTGGTGGGANTGGL
jgi:hypothetical protein